jgi:hypothetical protein
VDRDDRPGERGEYGSTVCAVRLPLSGSMSATTGIAPTATTALAVAMNVLAGTMTS